MPGKHNYPNHVREGFKHKHVPNPKKGQFTGKNKQNLSSHDKIAIPSKKDHNVLDHKYPHMMAPKKLKTDVGLHGPFKMVMGMHDNVSPGPMKKDHVQKFSYMYPQSNKFIGELTKAREAGKKTFKVDDKEYQVRMEHPMEYHGPMAYKGPNMADMPTPMDVHGKPMKYPRADYSASKVNENMFNSFDKKKKEDLKEQGKDKKPKDKNPKMQKPMNAIDGKSHAELKAAGGKAFDIHMRDHNKGVFPKKHH